MLLAALVATCAAFAPTYARAVDQAVLRSLVDDADPQRTTTHLSRPRTLSEPALTPDVVTAALPASLLALSGEPVAGMRYAQQVVPAREKKPSPVIVRSRDRMCEHLEVEGHCAEAAGEVLVSAADARAWEWREGTVLRIYQEKHDRLDDELPALELTVVGTYTVREDPGYWTGDLPDGKSGVPQQDLDNLPGIDDLLTPTSTFDGALPTATITVDLPLDRERVTLDTLPAAVDGLAALRTEHPEVAVDQPLTRRLAELRAGQEQTAVIVPLVMTQLALLAAIALYLVARGAVDQRRHDVALARLRGRSGAAARRLVLAELGVCVLVGVPVGLLVGVLLAWAAARGLLPGGVPLEVPAALLPWALGALLVSFGAMLLATRAIHREPVASLLRAARPERGGTTLPLVGGLLALLVTLGVALGALTGPVTLAAPMLLALGLGLVGSALLPRLAVRLGSRATRRGALRDALTAHGVARRPAPRRVLTASTVGVALAVFATTCVVVADGNRAARAELEVGAPVAVTVAVPGPRQLIDLADAVRDEGVAASPVVTIAQSDPDAPRTLAVDPATLPSVANASAIRGVPLAHLGTPEQESILLEGRGLRSRVSWDLRGDAPGTTIRLRAQLTAPDGDSRLRDLTVLQGRSGEQHVRAPLLCEGRCRLAALVAEVTLPDGETGTTTGTITIDGLAVDGRPVDLGSTSTWATPGGTSGSQDARLNAREATAGTLDLTLDSLDGADATIATTDVPRPLPAVVTRGVEGAADPDRVTVLTPGGLQTETQRRAQVTTLPRVTDRGVLVGLPTLARLGGGFDGRAQSEIWLADDSPETLAVVRQAADEAGIPLRSVATTSEAERRYDDSASGWGLALAAAAGAVGLALAALVTLVTAVTGWRRVVRDGAALLLSGISARVVRSALLREQLATAALALVLGTAAGVVGARVALPSVPLFADGVLVPEPSTAIPWVPVALTVLAAALVLLGVALAVGRLLGARTQPAAAQEVG